MTKAELQAHWRHAMGWPCFATCEPSMASIETADGKHRWCCECGAIGEWKAKIGSARAGASKHVTRQGRTKT